MVLNNQLPAFSSGGVLKLESNHRFCSKVVVVFLNFTLVCWGEGLQVLPTVDGGEVPKKL